VVHLAMHCFSVLQAPPLRNGEVKVKGKSKFRQFKPCGLCKGKNRRFVVIVPFEPALHIPPPGAQRVLTEASPAPFSTSGLFAAFVARFIDVKDLPGVLGNINL
jgi:hypothetical protein